MKLASTIILASMVGCSPVMAEDCLLPLDPAEVVLPETWLIVGQSNVERGGFVINFTREMMKAGRPIAALIATEGSTPISCWRRGGRCYETYVSGYVGNQIDGILYWQGESDGVAEDGDSWETYGDAFTSLIGEYREDFSDVPFVFITLEYYDADKATAGMQEPLTMTHVREQQGQALDLPQVYTIDARPYSTGELDLGPEQYRGIAYEAADLVTNL